MHVKAKNPHAALLLVRDGQGRKVKVTTVNKNTNYSEVVEGEHFSEIQHTIQGERDTPMEPSLPTNRQIDGASYGFGGSTRYPAYFGGNAANKCRD